MGTEGTRDEDALSEFQRAVEAHPEDPAAWIRYGRVLLDKGLLPEGLDALREAYRRDPESPRIRYHLGCALVENGRQKEAIEHFWSVCLDDPKLEDDDSALGLWALIKVARSYGKSGKWERAFDLLMPAARIAEEIVCNLAYFSQQQGEYNRAAYLFTIGTLLAPQNTKALYRAAYNKRKVGDLEGSRGDLERAVKLSPEDPELWYELGLTLAMMKKGAEARQVFGKVISLKADHVRAHYDLSCLDALEGKTDEAFANLNKAIDCGYRNLAHLEKDEDFKSVREDPRWKRILQRIPKEPHDRTRECIAFRHQGSQRVQ